MIHPTFWRQPETGTIEKRRAADEKGPIPHDGDLKSGTAFCRTQIATEHIRISLIIQDLNGFACQPDRLPGRARRFPAPEAPR